MNGPRFNEIKTTEAAVVILSLAGGRMSYMKLLKLLYLADRLAYLRWERAITNDHYISMDRGQVPSTTYDLIKEMTNEGKSIWEATFAKEGYEIESRGDHPEILKLSPAEVDVLEEIYGEYGTLDQFELGEITHNLPEYTEPEPGSMVRTPWNIFFRALEYNVEDTERIMTELNDEAIIDAMFGG